MLEKKRTGPAGNGTGSRDQRAVRSLAASLPGTAPNGTAATLAGYAVVVTVPADPEPRTRRRVYMSLHSAQKAVQRAEARGLDAQLVLVRLVPEGVGTW